MHKSLNVKLTSIFSPICQALIYESEQCPLNKSIQVLLDKSNELLVIRLHGTVIGYARFKLLIDDELALGSIYFRSIVKDHTLCEYWVTRSLKSHLKKNNYHHILCAS
ncbi:MAG: hypothetical protein V5786_02475 [Psychromonas sp.]